MMLSLKLFKILWSQTAHQLGEKGVQLLQWPCHYLKIVDLAQPILPAPPTRAPCKRMRIEEPTQEAAVLASEPAVVLDLIKHPLQAQLTTLHTDMVSQLTNLQDSFNSVQAKTTGLEASMVHMDQKLDLHLECIQEYQHQLCQTLHQDLERVFQHLAELKKIGGTPPVSLVRTMAALANEALQLYQ